MSLVGSSCILCMRILGYVAKLTGLAASQSFLSKILLGGFRRVSETKNEEPKRCFFVFCLKHPAPKMWSSCSNIPQPADT